MTEYSYFRFFIKNEKYPLYRKVAAFIFLLNALAFFYAGLHTDQSFPRILFIVIASLLLIYSLFAFFSKNDSDRTYIVLYIIAAMVWYTETDTWLPSVILLILMSLQIAAQTRISVAIDRNGVRIKSYSDNFYPWSELNNVVLKDGLLTIDLKSDKMFQLEPDMSLPVMIRKGGSHNETPWNVEENDYPDFEAAVNSAFLWKI